MSSAVQTVVEGLSYLECPRWHQDRIWFSDFYTHGVYSAAADGQDLKLEFEVPQQPSGLGWLPDGRMLVVSMKDRTLLRREGDGSLVVHADLSAHASGHLNDMVVDATGRAYVGEFGFDLMGGASLVPGKLIRVDPDGSATVVAGEMFFGNGMVITDSTLLVNETLGNRITAFDIAEDGALENRRSWAEFGPEPTARDTEPLLEQVVIAPDGCCLDAEGALWVADAVGGRAIRVLPGGTIADEVSPGSGVFACMLGGPDGRTLYLCAAPDFQEEARKTAREGRLLAVDVAVPHAGRP